MHRCQESSHNCLMISFIRSSCWRSSINLSSLPGSSESVKNSRQMTHHGHTHYLYQCESTEKSSGVEWPEVTRGIGHGRGHRVSPPQWELGLEWVSRNFFEFSSKKCGVLCIFIAKNRRCKILRGRGWKFSKLEGELNSPNFPDLYNTTIHS